MWWPGLRLYLADAVAENVAEQFVVVDAALHARVVVLDERPNLARALKTKIPGERGNELSAAGAIFWRESLVYKNISCKTSLNSPAWWRVVVEVPFEAAVDETSQPPTDADEFVGGSA